MRAYDSAVTAAPTPLEPAELVAMYATNRGLTISVATQTAAWEREVASQEPSADAALDVPLGMR
jgi:hypothetical protein